MSVKNFFDGLSDEVKAKLKDCKNEEELKIILADANIELSDDILEAISGGVGLEDLGGGICPLDGLSCRLYSTNCRMECSSYALQ